MNLLNYAKIIEPCQRNWDEQFIIPEEHIKYILDVCTTVPTKQNINVYSLVVITNRQVMSSIFKKAAYDHSPKSRTYMRNSQVNANALFIWTEGTEKAEDQSDIDIAIGISSGAAALAAAELGYKTGFCKCYMNTVLQKILAKNKVKRHNNSYLMLGIGKPNEKFDKRTPVINGKPQMPQDAQGDKDILIRRVY